MAQKTVFVFPSYGLGQTSDADLQIRLAKKFLTLLIETDPLPAQLCFFTDGVKLCVKRSPVLAELQALEARGVELVICSTCLETFGLTDQVAVGVVGGMGDILDSMTRADKTITV